MKKFLVLSLLAASLVACTSNQKPEQSQSDYGNPPAEGFNIEGSDVKAIAIADSVMQTMGGRKAWDEARFFEWNFFGARKHWWDKHTGDVRIESLRNDFKTCMNINTMEGQVFVDGMLQEHPDSLKKYLQLGKEMWINDAYWLVMPFKLKDSGVTLIYAGEDTLQTGQPAEVLELTFENVGVTPENKYQVFVNKETNLVEQWAYYNQNTDSLPRFITPWVNYQEMNGLMISGDRGVRQITEIALPDNIDRKLFTEL